MKPRSGIFRPGLLVALPVILAFLPLYAGDAAAQARDSRSEKLTEAIALGEARWKEGNFQGAHDWLSEALTLARSVGAGDVECGCLVRLGRLCWALGRPDDSQKYYAQARTAAERQASPKMTRASRVGLMILELYTLGKSERSAGRLEGSIKSLEEAVKWSRRLGSPEHEAKCLRQLSLSRLGAGQREAFLALNQQGLALARKMRDPTEQAKCLINLGSYDFEARNYNGALNDFSEAADLSKKSGNRADELASLKNIATILMELGFYERAVDYFQTVYDMDRASVNEYVPLDLNHLGQALRNRGILLSNKSDILKSVDLFQEALDGAQRQLDPRTQFISLNNLGHASLDLGNKHTALHDFEVASLLVQKLGDTDARITLLNNLGICRFQMGVFESARCYLEEALAENTQTAPHADIWETLFYLGRVCENQGNDDRALACYRGAMDAIDYVRSRLRIDEFMTGFVRNKAAVYESLVSLLLRHECRTGSPKREEEVFGVVERAKARAFLKTLATAEETPSDNQVPAPSVPENKLSREIAVLISRMARNDLDRKGRLELERTLRLKEDEYLRLLSRKYDELKGAEGLASPFPAGLRRIQERLLDEKTAILEYYMGKSLSLLLVITRGEIGVITLPSAGTLESSLGAYVRLLSEAPAGPWNGIAAGRRLFKVLLSDGVALLPRQIENLIIIPDGPLTGLPFETLPLPEASSAKDPYLISKYSVSYAASCSSLLFLGERAAKVPFSKDLLALGDPVYLHSRAAGKGKRLSEAGLMQDLYESQGFSLDPLRKSRDEVKRIAALFPEKKVDVYLGKLATESQLKNAALESYKVIHLACHAYQDEKVPFRSGLFLSFSPGQADDGFLYAREVAARRLQAELVVLSACRTSAGYVENGEGAMGLTRVFFYAGAHSVLSSIWEVSDRAAAEFMPRFYRHLQRGESKARALRSVKLEMLGSRYAHPFYWAAFVLAGEPFRGITAPEAAPSERR